MPGKGITIDFNANLTRFVNSVDRATNRLNRFESNSKRIARNLGGVFAGVAIGRSIAQGFSAGVRSAANFEQQIANIGARTGATSGELERLAELARDLGGTTSFSAIQAAQGIEFLGKAGFETAEIFEALPSTLNLAKVGSLELGRAADIASNVLSGFGLAAGETERVVDVLAATASGSNTSVEQLGEALKTVAPVAASLGLSIEETSAALGTLGDAGLQASVAGTGLRGVLASLTDVTDKAQSALEGVGLTAEAVSLRNKSLTEIIQTLAEAGLEAEDAFQIFGREGATAALALTRQNRGLQEFNRELENVDEFARDAARAVGDTLLGDVTQLGSAVSELGLQLASDTGLTGALRSATQGLTEFVRSVSDGLDKVARFTNVIRAQSGGIFDFLESDLADSEQGITSRLGAIRAELQDTREAIASQSQEGLLGDAARFLADKDIQTLRNDEIILEQQLEFLERRRVRLRDVRLGLRQDAEATAGAADTATDAGLVDPTIGSDEIGRRQRENAQREEEALRRRQRLIQEGIDFTDRFRTAQEIYNDEVAEARQLLDAQLISQETFNRAFVEYGQELDRAEGRTGFIENLRTFAEATREALDPTIAYQRELERIAQAEEAGLLSAAEAIDAAAEAARRANPEIEAIGDALEENKSFSDEFGLSFTSALEDAIVKGESLQDILQSVGQDLLKISTQQLVTEPLGQAVSGAIGGFDFGNLFGNLFTAQRGGLFKVAGTGGPDSQVVALRTTPGETLEVRTPQQQAAAGGTTIINNQFPSVRDYSQFQLSQREFNAMQLASLGVS